MRAYIQRLRDLRTDRELSQVGKYERGKQELPIRHLITLCNYYGVSADYILGLPEGRPYGFSRTK